MLLRDPVNIHVYINWVAPGSGWMWASIISCFPLHMIKYLHIQYIWASHNGSATQTHLLGSPLECPTLPHQTGEDPLSSIQQMPGHMCVCVCVCVREREREREKERERETEGGGK